ncbi:PKD domain-containing protein [Winogradskyella psychrotolerans]|uniref:PKD domain-containing protein n=1 Tax=Winogradskyella psychrotolerans TaxID=1344585 RepID=UPI001C066087|nr:PKD domain-containing protein [Winogradskyella psychrotolerans]MBU2929121.1 PKD domain-containing protein [Winogradskyella psychrotolerans]
MKAVKYIFSLCLILFLVNSCDKDDSNTDFVDSAVAPTDVSALFEVTQDNTGLVTITPTAQGAVGFNIFYGDDTVEPASLSQGENTTHTYAEGTYSVVVVALGPTGLETELTQDLVVSFNPPENMVATAENDAAVSKQVNVTASADNAISFSVDYGDGSELVVGNIGESVSHIYENAGLYTITVVAMGAAIETTEVVIADFEVTEIVQPLVSAPDQPYRAEGDVVSIFSGAYTDISGVDFYPNWGQATTYNLFDLSGDEMLQYTNLNYQGIDFSGTPIDVSQMEYIHVDVWTADENDAKLSPISSGPNEAAYDLDLTAQEWTSFDIPLSYFTDQNPLVDFSNIIQFKFDGDPAEGTIFVDNLYFYKSPSDAPTGIVGTWKLSQVAGSLGVGPADGDNSWWNCDAGCISDRACYYDDEYIFNEDGSFSNVLGGETWVEAWQGGGNGCGTPVAPHDGSNPATYVYDESSGTVTLNGLGAFLGIPKAVNDGELANIADTPTSVTYNVTLSNFDTEMYVSIDVGDGVYWQYNFIKDGAAATSPLAGTWQMSTDSGSLGVGPAPGDNSWWNCDDSCVTSRACYYDDQYVFGTDGSFSNVLGSETWVEPWQGGGDACGAPVAPHDGSGTATFDLDLGAGTLTLNGVGAYIGLAKAVNGTELTDPLDAPASIVYDIAFIDNDTISVMVDVGDGVYWQYKLVKI